MNSRNEQLLQRLLAMFTVEAEDHATALGAALLELDRGVAEERRRELVEKIFRQVHTLKGAARTVNLGSLVALCHALESLLALVKQGNMALDGDLRELLHRSLGAIRVMIPGGGNGPSPADPPGLDRLVGDINHKAGAPGMASPPPPPLPPPIPAPAPPVATVAEIPAAVPPVPEQAAAHRPVKQTVRVPIAQLDRLLHQAEELIGAKLSGAERAAMLRGLGRELGERTRSRSRLGRAAQADHDAQTLAWLGSRLSKLATEADQEARGLAKSVDGLLSGTKQVLMQPATNLLDLVAQNVRELSREQGKDIQLVVAGEGLELDRRVQEELRDALLHLIRNAIGHGLETPAERLAQGKPGQGTLSISLAPRDGGRAEITISDDGRGMDGGRLVAEAIAQGVVDAEEAAALNQGQILALAFQSGLSTSSGLTDLSGRGLGLAIVQEKVERLGGTIAVETAPGAGTSFRLLLPVTMAAFRVVMTRVGTQCLALPTNRVERVARIPWRAVELVDQREVVRVDGKAVGLVRLADLLRLSGGPEPEGEFRHYLVVAAAGQRIAIEVDQIIGETEILMKSLGWPLAQVACVAGAIMLPSGGLGFVLNVHELLRSALRQDFPTRPARSLTSMAAPARKSILIAEDSITARTLFKHVLEAAGYRVRTAVDGLEAWGLLAEESFDLIVSDVEMPRMSGFELTGKIRHDPRTADLPVILITSLETREDRERGVDVGASAYIVKKSFDQSDLLDMIGRLL
ncbi:MULTISPECIES: response regulator [unclassified Azospirillum]|uniref:hybrid sensor histidine kinase/response regulator n=1 Tax=unclassified Azospirillum TaxID=2630922 RepID=UPI000B6B52D2|nr:MULTISPECIES: response regulator [unclassified Azospirillum]SNS48633.1 two-component system, chemotaxis family, sensor kinase CheA [Azospirillum sp. RU38E]SNS67793.1 two-component system, chemotaxis family, sensor kinase CheA [Azospirillum sp. RU37A]